MSWGDCAGCKRLKESGKKSGKKKPERDGPELGEWREEFGEFLCGSCYFDAGDKNEEAAEGPDPGELPAMS